MLLKEFKKNHALALMHKAQVASFYIAKGRSFE